MITADGRIEPGCASRAMTCVALEPVRQGHVSKSTCAVLAALLVLGCGSEGAENGVPERAVSENPALDFTKFDVQWRPEAVVLDDVPAVQHALVRADLEAGELVFAPTYSGLRDLVTDTATLIGGVGAFRVIGREATSEGALVRVEAVPLTEVIQSGTIAWRRSFVSAFPASGLGLGIDENEADSIRQIRQPLGSFKNGELDYSGVIGKFATTAHVKPTTNGLQLSLSSNYKDGRATANATLSGTVHGITNETEIEFAGAVVTGYDVRFTDVDGDIAIEAGASELSGGQKVQVPARLSLPFLVGPVPFNIELGTSLEFTSTLTANSSALLKGKTSFKGTIEARKVGADVQYFSSFSIADLTFEHAEQTGVVTAGLDWLLNFPELSIGVGVPRVATVNAFARVKSEILSNMTIKYDNGGVVPVVAGSCITGSVNLGSSYGGNIAFLGTTVAEKEHPLFGKLGTERSEGDGCP